ncbi:MAG TPA: C4-dicarboxylate ABC transporter, partial [Casimicrobiaceae bacterium]
SYALEACKEDDKKVADVFTKAGDKVYDMNEQQFEEWKALAEKSAWKSFADSMKDGAKLIEMANAVQ